VTAGARFLDPKALARIRDLELVARGVVEGFVSGLHRSPWLGVSVDFAEHRPYQPGDDIRRVDWRVYARSDRFYVKQFEADSNANFMILLDASSSMRFGTAGLTKLDYGRMLAACLAWLARGQRDRIGLMTFAGRVLDVVPPGARNLEPILHALDRVGEGGAGTLREPLQRAAQLSRRRGLVAVISDFYEDPEEVQRAVAALGWRGSDVMAFHVLDPAERELPFDEAQPFEDMESGERIGVAPDAIRGSYQALVAEHVKALERRLESGRAEYVLLDTREPLDRALARFLTRRQRTGRTR
jgi:uncharacterized protein (DUF58 family)